ncbi:hypothetical protein [Periweissella fabalis]|uniref:Uncharacterized protein n=1 Tax=Periweissella fabalis TaxID=1070421 RepID=A0A7X6N0E7_9LACO|nr:hypothetical protein [Periweissella fabalis]MCM0599209.1 hypothetical protein [Periweissella fabalis]NKZ23488.1 hypothetical protein [Periweissella fabalis]
MSFEEVTNALAQLQNEYAPILEVSEEQIEEIDNFMLPWRDRKSGYLDINYKLGVQSWVILQAQWHPETVRIVEKSEQELQKFYYGKRREKIL